ncbi:MAG: VOC family protein [Pseudomonadales bacterium]|nr:VOC family protein [Pseudomonadales bacterium]MBO7006840.1 VOC family protein [Pseudomonadales bacterium]
MKLDHIMFAVADLDHGIELIRDLTGVAPAFGGVHPGHGTRNALLSLGEDQYLEVIAPDPEQQLEGTMAEELLQSPPHIRQWAAMTDDFDHLKHHIEHAGFRYRVMDMARTTPVGLHLAWQILFVEDHPYGAAMPFFIDWLESPHPAASTPKGCSLERFNVQSPQGNTLREFFGAIGLKAGVDNGELAMSSEIQSPAGPVSLA